MKCYLCGLANFKKRKGRVRDRNDLWVIECESCSFVMLSSIDHISPSHYSNSGMHADALSDVNSWLLNVEKDDQRRFEMLEHSVLEKKVLDFGCGAAGFLKKAQSKAAVAIGVEPETRVRDYWKGSITIYENMESVPGEYDLITAFHVIEHLPDPRSTLRKFASKLSPCGRIVIEVPSSNDALLTLYDNKAFQDFTYWSQHLYLFNPVTLTQLISQSGLKLIALKQYQRYPLSNHLFWLSQGKPGGHKEWSFLNTPELIAAYSSTLSSLGLCDSLIAYIEKSDL